MVMDVKDRERLRYLASKQIEIANSQKNLDRVELWKRHNMCKGERPVIHIEVDTFAHEAIKPHMQCEDGFARGLEYRLLHNMINMDTFDDDRVVPPYFQTEYHSWFSLFGHNIKQSVVKKEDGTEMGHKFEHIIDDLGDDFDKVLSPSQYGVDKDGTKKYVDEVNDVFGDILPVKLVSNCLYSVPTQHVVHMMGMENMLYSMYDYPDEFKEMMNHISNDYIQYFKHLEKEGVLLQNHAFESVGQGTMAFFDEKVKNGPVKTTDLWGFMDSQETVGISPDMFREFIFPYYKRVAENFGRLSYGCCEPVNGFWDDIKTLPNLKKVSISPWCDEEFMANELKGSGIIYHRKPSPNFLGVGANLDEDGFRAHIEKTLKTARGCNVEITQRDVYTVNNDINKVKRYVEIIRESIENYWE
ncbi:MAG: hypothetical protein IJ316_04305 [Clostridia bacterium]|nr:hypothetical protein [Clostridia bacterium]